MSGPVARPDYWVRTREGASGWWCSSVPPSAPREREGRLSYRCPACKATHRLVEVLNGDLAEILDTVTTFYTSEKLKDATVV